MTSRLTHHQGPPPRRRLVEAVIRDLIIAVAIAIQVILIVGFVVSSLGIGPNDGLTVGPDRPPPPVASTL
jgi:hypothetical protein